MALTRDIRASVFVSFLDSDDCRSYWHYGEDGPRAWGWVSERYNELTPTHLLERICPAEEGRYVTVFALCRSALKAGLDRVSKVIGADGH